MTDTTSASTIVVFATVAVTASLLSVIAYPVFFYAFFKYGYVIGNISNDFFFGMTTTMFVQAFNMGVFTGITSFQRTPLNPSLCQISAITNNFLDAANQVLVVGFYLSILMHSRFYRIKYFILLLALAWGSGATIIMNYYVTGDYGQDAGWCWIPRNEGLSKVRFLLGYVHCAILVVVGLLTAVVLRTHSRLPFFRHSTVYGRFFAISGVLLLIYVPMVVDKLNPSVFFAAMTSFMYPATAFFFVVIFLWSERLFSVLFCGGHINPHAFTPTINGMLAQEVIGLHDDGQYVSDTDKTKYEALLRKGGGRSSKSSSRQSRGSDGEAADT